MIELLRKGLWLIQFCLIFILLSCKKGKGAICNDGWRSHSTGSGTCSWHDGIDHYIDPNEIDVVKTTFLVIFLIVCFAILVMSSKRK
jgi:hypothetical protein